MELWIRSQDRKRLIKAYNLVLNKCTDCCVIKCNERNDNILGVYNTEERALEVLDDIEDKLINCTFAKKRNGLGEVLDFMPNSIYVYTMPKE